MLCGERHRQIVGVQLEPRRRLAVFVFPRLSTAVRCSDRATCSLPKVSESADMLLVVPTGASVPMHGMRVALHAVPVCALAGQARL